MKQQMNGSLSIRLFLLAALAIAASVVATAANPDEGQGGSVAFAATERTRLDNTAGYIDSIGLSSYNGAPIKAIQFRMRNTNGKIRIAKAELAPRLRDDPRWLCMWHIGRGPILPDLSTNDTLSVVILGQENAVLDAADAAALVYFTYDVVNIDGATPGMTELELFDVVGSLVGGEDAQLLAGEHHTIIVRNTVEKGDVNFDDDVNINDLLEVMRVILGKATLFPEARDRADIAPWPGGDGTIDVKDLAMTQQVILEGRYPNGTELGVAPVANALSLKSAGAGSAEIDKHESANPKVAHSDASLVQAKVTVYVTKSGIHVRLENTVNVKGIQLELGNIPTVPDTVKVNTIWGPGSYGFTNNVLRVLALDQSGASVVQPGNRLVIDVAFDIANPLQVSFKKLIVAKEDNSALTDIEASIVYGPPNAITAAPPLPAYELGQNYPNPFNPSTRIPFQLPARGDVRLVIFNTAGVAVRTLYSGLAESGRHNLQWDGTADDGTVLPAGLYFYTLFTPSTRFTRKMLYIQ